MKMNILIKKNNKALQMIIITIGSMTKALRHQEFKRLNKNY